MSHFYGTLNGSRGEATRCGDKKTGLAAVAASYEGAVMAHVYHNAEAKADYVRIDFIKWHGEGRSLTIYDGPVNPRDEEIFACMVKHAPAALGVKG